jgi:Ca2+-binding EF-hand superfamily protein
MQGTDPVMNEVEETFERLDANGDQSIDFEEFAKLMREIDHTRSSTALRARFNAIDTNRDGRVDFDEFRTWCGGCN